MLLALLPVFAQSVVLSGATVHSMVPGEAPRRADVVVEGETIRAIVAAGATDGVPADAKRVDLSGLHLFPGLIDGLVQHDPDHDRLYVAAGVTLVRDPGSDLTPAVAERDRKARDRGPGPWLLTAGATIAAPDARTGILAANAGEAQDKLKRALDLYPLDFVSFQPNVARDTWLAVIGTAHERDKQVWGPLAHGVSLEDALAAKQDGFFELGVLLPPGKHWGDAADDALAARASAFASSSSALVPMIATHATRLVQPHLDTPELLHLAPIYVQQWTTDALAREAFFTGKDALERQKTGVAALQRELATLRALWEKQARLVPGSASPNAWIFPGRGLIEELALWCRAGIPPAEVVRAATAGAARILGVDEQRGTLAAGKVADLVAFTGDPEQDLAALRDPRCVVLRGRVLARADLDLLLADLKARQLAQQKRVLGREPLPLGELPLPAGDVILHGRADQRLSSLRLATERFALVRGADGSLTWVTRMLTLGSTTVADTELVLSQTIQGGLVQEFELTVTTGPRTVATKGKRVANALNVERRLDGNFVDNKPIRDAITFVDVGGATSALAGAHHGRDGQFKVLFFEDFEPAYGPWLMRVDEQKNLLWQTPTGVMSATFDDSGRPTKLARERGNEIVAWSFADLVWPDNGWPLPQSNRTPSKKPEGAPAPAAPSAGSPR